MKISHVVFGGLLLVLSAACRKDEVNPRNPKDRSFELHIDFWNPQGNDPQIRFDADNSSPEVRIDFTQTFAGVAVPPNFTHVIIENVRLIDQHNNNYQINQIDAYEWRQDIKDWKHDVEFLMHFDYVQDLAVVLVLDASESLGNDFETTKAYANDFISKVFAQNPTARIGIVDFSDKINAFGLSSNPTALSSYISGIKKGPFTTLYEAMDLGIEMLKNAQAESKALLTFTDGTDNNSGPQYTPAYLIERLSNSNGGVPITSFTIGLEGKGGVDRPVLNALAVHGGSAAFPKSVQELGNVYDAFAQGISTVYNLRYVRNQQVIPEATPAKLRFVLDASPKRS